MTTTTKLVRIGNSRGFRVPKLLLERANLPDEVELRAEPGRIVVSAVRRPRVGWAKQAEKMRFRGDDAPLDSPTPTKLDDTDWRW